MIEPYENKPASETGGTTIAPDDLNRLVRLLDARGWQISAAATGDRAIRMALDAYDHAVRSNPLPERGRRHRIDRIGIVDPADLPRFGRLNIIASLQPEVGQMDAWIRGLGAERAERALPYASLAAAGGRLALGTGWPAGPLNPLAAISAAVNRGLEDSDPQPERLAVKRAVAALTSGPAYASFDEQRKGSLKPGMLADIVVLTHDIFDAPGRLASTSVAVTIFDGKIVYRRGDTQSLITNHESLITNR
jgi:predicted amidohydrolase YtcJ